MIAPVTPRSIVVTPKGDHRYAVKCDGVQVDAAQPIIVSALVLAELFDRALATPPSTPPPTKRRVGFAPPVVTIEGST